MSRRATVLWSVLAVGCAGADGGWRLVDPAREWIQVTGTVAAMDLPDAGDVRLDIEPAPGEEGCLAPGQRSLGCIVRAGQRRDVAPVLARLGVGDRVTVAGYWAARTEDGATLHYLSDTTSIRRVR